MIRPFVKAAVRCVGEVDAVGGIDDPIESGGAGFEPTVDSRLRDRTADVGVRGDCLCVTM